MTRLQIPSQSTGRPPSGAPNMERPMRCSCDDSTLSAPPRNTIASYEVQLVDGVPEKAKIWPGTGRIQIDKRFWKALGSLQQTAVLAHELAHDENPDACEECADARAGARMRYEGISAQAAVSAFSSVVGHRRTGASVLYGWKVADATITHRGDARASGELEHTEEQITPKASPTYQGGASSSPRSQLVRRRAPSAAHLDEGEDFGSETSIGAPAASVSGVEDSGAQQSIDTTQPVGASRGPLFQTTGGNVQGVSGGQVNNANTVRAPGTSSARGPASSATMSKGVAGVLVVAGAVVLVVLIVRALRKAA